MILCNINKSEIPTLSARKGCEVKDVQLNDLRTDGVNLVSYGLKEGDQFEFPDTIEDVKLKKFYFKLIFYKFTFKNTIHFLSNRQKT